MIINIVKRIYLIMVALVSNIAKAAQKALGFNVFSRMVGSTSGPNLNEIREELSKFEGGSVDLEMDEQTGIAVMTLNNPRRLNSLTGKMMIDMADRITELEHWKQGKGLILRGSGGNFCSGGDLTFVRKALHYGAEMATYQHHTLSRLLNLPLISVALLQGHTLGGGAELSTACDFRVMSAMGKVGFVQIKMGLTPGWGATTRLVHLLGRQKTLSLLASAAIMSAEEAQTIGLADMVMPYHLTQEAEVTEVKKWLEVNYCRHNEELVQAVKSSVVFSDLNRDLQTSYQNEKEVFTKFWGGPINKAALSANIKHKK